MSNQDLCPNCGDNGNYDYLIGELACGTCLRPWVKPSILERFKRWFVEVLGNR